MILSDFFSETWLKVICLEVIVSSIENGEELCIGVCFRFFYSYERLGTTKIIGLG